MGFFSELDAALTAREEWSRDRFGARPVLPADAEEVAKPHRSRWCQWCGGMLIGSELRGETCNACLSGENACDACGLPLKDHENGCPAVPPPSPCRDGIRDRRENARLAPLTLS